MHKLASKTRLHELAEEHNVPEGLFAAPLTYMSAVLVRDLGDPRLRAVEESLRVTMGSGDAAHLVLLDDRSAPGVEERLRRTDALIVPIDGTKEGGLVEPYLLGIQLVRVYGREKARVVKVEGEKPIGTRENTTAFLRALRRNSVVVGRRSEETWASMPPYQAMTERLLGPAIGDQLWVPSDTPSGVLGLDPNGMTVMLGTRWKKWEYLFGVPLRASRMNLPVDDLEITWQYPDVVRRQETDNPDFDKKRRGQVDDMLNEAAIMADEFGLKPSPLVVELRDLCEQWEGELAANA